MSSRKRSLLSLLNEEVVHKSRIQQPPKRQSLDLSFHKLALSLQEQEEIGGPSSSQDLMKEIEEVPDTPASDENEYI
ncbi:hypothetical protein F8M41_002162 [Gigaspora margarita]|uniref:Uncharacterized protein n=1 Tax=Gigaspora margarita TaxID=4874 RepID=A0A8H3XER1_GIGMA|nr:hypothetical protein F8M41_002162 [Gigaspora margarita]